MDYTVYVHTTPNNKKYVGITRQNINDRWKNSLGYKTQTLFYKAIQKYGWKNIKHEIIATELSHDEACDMEIKLIAQFKSNNPKYGYNRTNGGDGTVEFSHPNPRTPEWTKKIADANRGKKRTLEQRQKMSLSRKGKKASQHHNDAIKLAYKEGRLKYNTKLLKASNEARRIPIVQLNKDGTIIATYRTMTECARCLNYSISTISDVINGKKGKGKYKHKFPYILKRGEK